MHVASRLACRRVVGSLQERELLEHVFRNADALNEDVAVAMQPPLRAVDADAR